MHSEKKQNQRKLATQSQGSKIVSTNDDQDCRVTEKSKTGEIRRHKAMALKLSKDNHERPAAEGKTRETWRRKVMGLKSGFFKKFLLTMIARLPNSA